MQNVVNMYMHLNLMKETPTQIQLFSSQSNIKVNAPIPNLDQYNY